MRGDFRRRFIRVNRIYIMPSGRGALFLAAIVVMILTAASYNNNLIFILAFFLFALFVVSMLQTHYNLKGVRADYVGAEDAFEGGEIVLRFQLVQKRAVLKRALELRSTSRTFKSSSSPRETIAVGERIHPAALKVHAAKRGVHPAPQIVLETFFPLGLFRAWKVFRPSGDMYVYPRPEGEASPPLVSEAAGESETGLRSTPDGDFGELKNYVEGESYHQIAWKHFARTGHLLSKVHWGAQHRHYALRVPAASTGMESELRQLSRWVERALNEDATLELETPTFKLETGRGPEHAREAWRALARIRREP